MCIVGLLLSPCDCDHLLVCRLRQIRERDSDTAGSSDDEQKGWMAKMAHASAVERGNEDSGLPETGRGNSSAKSLPGSPAQSGEGRPPWKASSQQAIPLKGRRQHGSSNALSLMHMSPSPAARALDISEGGWMPQ